MNFKRIKKIAKRKVRFIIDPLKEYLSNKRVRIRAKYSQYVSLPIKEKTVLYEAYHGRSISGNCYAIFLKLVQDKDFKDYHHVWVINDISDPMVEELKRNYQNVSFTSVDSNHYLKYLATSKYLINDTSFPFYFVKRDEQIYINTWHGTPLKTLGLDIKNRGMSTHKNIQRNLLHSDYLISPNQFTYEKLLKSHDIYEIYAGKVADIGYPRTDLTLETNGEEVRKTLNIPLDKKVILYAPTWRGTVGKENDTSQVLLDEVMDIQKSMGDDYIVLLKSHYFTFEYFKKNKLDHLCVPNWYDTNKLLAAVDILITDYSSIFFDFLPLKKPVLFYMIDHQEYEAERGFYLDINNLPGPVCESLNELIDKLQNIHILKKEFSEQYDKYLEEFCYNDDGQASKRLVEMIFKKQNQEQLISTETDKQKLLFYCGGFYNNGITMSAINLFDHIDYSKYEVTVIDNANEHKDKWKNIRKLNPKVHVLYRPGVFNKTLKETYEHQLVLRRGIYTDSMSKTAPVKAYQRELKRIIGNAKFDIGIDFGGYNKFWSMLFAFGQFKTRSIYLHNDMMEEYNKKINGKYKHRKNLKVIFSLYKYYDKVVSVAKSANEENYKNLRQFIPDADRKMVYVDNVIGSKQILKNKDIKNTVQTNGKEYLILREQNEENPNILNIFGLTVPKKENYNFINIGRLSPEKGQEKLINSFAQLHKEFPNSKLYIVGDGPLKKQLTLQAETLGLENDIIFAGQLENPFALLDECDCFVLSSDYEGQGLVLMEAMIVGKPIIATDVTGVRSVLEGGLGLLVENTEEALTEAMKKYITEGIEYRTFDYESYNNHALQLFYKNVCQS
ncbi:CDP-glycerol glycerophosphotransferase family protein [Bacillus haynesii]|uniref:glycosyltransferase n=1 Tax=Bacillus haynesii TaxID=1925021 RepID=UPI00227FB09A|nr:glycosyltransferase [Bacillus haynesii]MCY7752474.1 CDP-glycerol glycerophosphotransferase family protein [Bacillus haynesii]MCY8383000.1 CDP-glycerol glycerophosphotransferase family protein [Bacillus haynesii]MCY8587904.1 CDP-glycerol glycerophosphotransferase family protein [Bacillus haynesii]MCY9223963.1 CDP-glycerol glycerophosphotransferase family protein [Bacillus haynesii]